MPTVHGVTTPESVDQPVVHEDLAALARQLLLRDTMTFANTAERTAFFTSLGISPSHGAQSFLLDVLRYDTYDGIGWGPLLPQLRMKTADQAVPNATVVNDDTFVFTLAANTRYALTSALFITGADGNNVGEINCRYTMPALCEIDWGEHSPTFGLASGSIGDGAWSAARDTASPTVGIVLGTSVAASMSELKAGIENGANAGVLQFQWAQNTPTGTASVIRRRSWMRLERVP